MGKVTKAAAQPKPQTIALVKGATVPNYRGARAAWFSHLQTQVGNTPAQFAAAAIANPPSMPKHGKLANTCEPPAGWLRFFVKQGIAVIG